ncbi:MAG: PAS domain S-box protein [Planctomycetes bacterium]|nr:PAS domain S-box protein [Planctomycetota bacterium]
MGLPFSVVGIGASAGGLEAFTQLLRALPVDTGMAFVLVQHLSPKHESALAEILSRATRMTVAEVVDEPALEPNHVYVIPPDRDMLIAHGHLRLMPRQPRGMQHPIDQFFRSLAAHQRELSIGIVLSGTATDGTLGLEEIKAEGGITFAQDESAQQQGMPQSAVASGCVDFVLPPEDIAAEIARIGKHPYHATSTHRRGRDTARRSAVLQKSSLAPVLDLLRNATGVDFNQYKVNTLQRRIGRRMILQQLESIEAYAAFARKNRSELDALYQDILINVTSFFRDPGVYEALRRKVLPKLLKGRTRHDPLRIWVLGCSTGEEAYSYAMVVAESLEAANGPTSAQIFATDLNPAGIERARAGVYSKERLQDVSRERQRRFFVEQSGELRVAKGIRDMCVFSAHNVMTDPPFSRMDLVSCRNLLIYLEPELQQRILPLLHYALKPKGVLVLGASESIGRFGELFGVENGEHKIFVKKPGTLHVPSMPAALVRPAAAPSRAGRPTKIPLAATPRPVLLLGLDVHKEADRLLASFAPPAVLVDANLEILQFRGNTEPYLVPSQGRASHALLKMAREELLVPLQSLLQRARKQNTPARAEGLRVKSAGRQHEFDLEVLPVRGATNTSGCLLVLFLERPAAATPLANGEKNGRRRATENSASATKLARTNIARLEQELASTREHLQAVMEQFEATNEELQSSNEETQSANEELQSINEELETSKEEIQSSNEELSTVNDELRNRNSELGRLNSDLTNLISSVNLAVLIVGRDLRIRRFSPMAEKLLSIIPTDVGRPISDIRMKLVVPDLDALLTESIDTITPIEREVEGGDSRWYSVRIRPYLTAENKIDGAVLTLIDIDAIRRAREYAETIVATVREPLLVLDSNLRVQSAGRAFYEHFRLEREAVVGRPFYELEGGKWDNPDLRRLLGGVLARDSSFDDFTFERPFQHIGQRTLLLSGRRLRVPGAERPSILLAIEDVTLRNQTENALSQSETRYRRLFESAKDGILILDAQSATITDANPYIGQLLGYSHAELLGKELWQIGLFQDASASRAAVVKLQAQGYIRYEDLPLKTKTGQSIQVEFVSNVYAQEQHSVIQCNIRDITGRKLLESDLAKRNDDLAAADEAKNNFLAVLSHELRSPLNILLLWSQILRQPGVEQETLRKGLDIIEASTKAQAQLIEDLLDVHRISTGKVRLDVSEVDLAAILRAVLDSLAPSATEKGLALEHEIELAPAPVSGDPARLEQVIRNLLGNSIKFTPRDGRIRVVLRRQAAYVELRFSDTGEGISAAALPHIFERFRQADPLTNHSSSGLGLGLAIAKQLVDLHGGTITADSPGRGRGATFTVALPLLLAEAVPRKPRILAGQSVTAAPTSLAGVLVLVVDDEPQTREAVRHVLEQAGAETNGVASTDEALESLRLQQPDLILSDIGMPGRDGYEFMRAVRALPASRGGSLPALALSAYARAEDRERALAAGFDGHLAKPVESERLVAALAALLAKKVADTGASKPSSSKRKRGPGNDR